MPFEQLSRKIIQQSIKSAVFIDDEVVNPYDNDNKNFEFSQKLFNDFRKSICSLDIFKFNDYDEFETKKEFFLKRRDLLIIDWDLKNDTDPYYLDALKILEQAILTKSLHFICIYTNSPQNNFIDKIFYKIIAYLRNIVSEKVAECLSQIKEITGEEELNNTIKGFLKELVIRPENKEQVEKEIFDEFEKLKPQCTNTIKGVIGKILQQKVVEGLINIGFFVNGCYIRSINDEFTVRLVDDNTFYINDTILKIFNKQEIAPELLFNELSRALLSTQGNFMTLLGFEMRNMFLESTAFMGKEIDDINEMSFFYHQWKIKPREAFYDFIRQIWKEQAYSFLTVKDPEIFGVLEEYKLKKGITEEKLKGYQPSLENQTDLARLNYYYNILFLNRIEQDRIRFGDIFKIFYWDEKGRINPSNNYLLNITSHCDCLYPDNIDNQFLFVKGTQAELIDALEKGDTGFDSYIKCRNEIIAIHWDTKPFTIHIPSEMNDLSKTIDVMLAARRVRLVHKCCIKENYAQRIANNSFLNASRVGILFSDFKDFKKQ